MGKVIKRTIGHCDFAFYIASLSDRGNDSISGVLLVGDCNPYSEWFHDALIKAYDMIPVLEDWHGLLEKIDAGETEYPKLASWTEEDIADFVYTAKFVVEEQKHVELTIEERNNLVHAANRAIEEYERRREHDRQQAEQVKNARRGYVYLLQSPSTAYKIGRSKDPKNRLKTFGIQLPFEVEYICLIETNDMHTLEAELHERYASKRINGEWFTLSDEDVEYIKGLAS